LSSKIKGIDIFVELSFTGNFYHLLLLLKSDWFSNAWSNNRLLLFLYSQLLIFTVCFFPEMLT